MRVGGVPVLPVLVAAIAIYAIGFVMYGLLFDELWMRLAGFDEASAADEMWRMSLSPIMPILTAIGLAIVYRWAGVNSVGRAVQVSFVLWLCFAFVVLMYGFTYSAQNPGLLLMDSVHLLLDLVVGGAIIAAWPRVREGTAAAA
jgi:hypothetical protein